MRLKILGSSSAGNCYFLEANNGDTLIIECGVRFAEIKRSLNFNLAKVVGTLISHEHGDHCKAVKDLTRAGMDVYASSGTCQALIEKFRPNPHRIHPRHTKLPFSLGVFRIIMFTTVHDCNEPTGFLIQHPECGVVLFISDTVYSPFVFAGLNQVMIEANYCDQILEEKRRQGATIEMLRDRVIESHMSLKNCKDMLAANDLTGVNNLVLLHLSDSHSDELRFKREVEELTGKAVHVADKDMVIENFNRTPF